MKILGPKLHKKLGPKPPERPKPPPRNFRFILPRKRKCCGG